ncbi:MAG TPA: AmmeMemoRadiSam system protein A [Thermoanaerobaculia bacterium]
MLTPEQRNRLLHVARTTIASMLDGLRREWPADDFEEELRRPSGVFVTLHKNGELRGCIGSIHPIAPLYEAVSSSAINAAFRDPRFPPVRKDELREVEIEISVMSPIEPVANPEDILVGRDGLIVSRGGYRGLLLPQVATDYGWDREAFLSQTCRKAGLPMDAWRSPGVQIEKFSAEVFGE